MKILFITAVGLFFMTASLYAQQRSMTVEYIDGGKKVIKEYKGAELEKLMQEAQAHSDQLRSATNKTETTKERQIITQIGGEEPVTYKGAKLDKLIQQNAGASAERQKPAAPSSNSITVTAVRQPDGSVKVIQSSAPGILQK